MNTSLRRLALPAFLLGWSLLGLAPSAEAQVVYYGAYRPVIAAPVVAAPVMPVMAPAYVANYTPAGNYAAVTAFSPPVYAQPSAVAVTAAYAPVMSAPVAVTSYYAPTTVYSPPVAEVVAAPVTAYYAPAAVAVPLYRRGPFGGLRPVRSAYFLGY